ncbi:MAG: hypothetical protein M3458_13725 [Acidobacteriota bacterium]|nr:hypothetical protein [Acidobacteriota bacterium]
MALIVNAFEGFWSSSSLNPAHDNVNQHSRSRQAAFHKFEVGGVNLQKIEFRKVNQIAILIDSD